MSDEKDLEQRIDWWMNTAMKDRSRGQYLFEMADLVTDLIADRQRLMEELARLKGEEK